jgi:hypothetical protein
VIYTGVYVQLVMRESSWIQILADDVKVFEGIVQAGETPNWSGERRVAIRAGNGGGVEVVVNGQSRGLMGAEGEIVDQIWEKVESPEAAIPSPGPTLEPIVPLTGTGTPQP